jgi:hypothetical protein
VLAARYISFTQVLDERPDHPGRIHEALQMPNKARADIAREEDNVFVNGLRDRAIGHIDAADIFAGISGLQVHATAEE